MSSTPPAAGPGSAPLTVMVVDDEQDNLDVYRRTLRGYHLVTAIRADQALPMLAEHGVDIMITDQQMPGMTGAKLLERVRAVNPIARRIIVSAHADPKTLLEAINRGEVERYLVKPVAPEVLREAVDSLAADYRRMQEERARVAELEDQLSQLRQKLRGVEASPDGWERLELEVTRAWRYGRPLALIVIDSASHLRGAIQAAVREVDLVVPVGDRLVLALPETDRAGAEITRARLSRAFPAVKLRVATYPVDGADVAALVAAAR